MGQQIQLRLRESMFGGLTGTASVPDTPSLSWVDSQALRSTAAAAHRTAAAAQETAAATQDTADAVVGVGMQIAAVRNAVLSLESRVGLALDRQSAALTEQTALLERIDASLRNPAKVRAAERVSDAGKLLARGRYERALQLAHEAIDDDPVGTGGFLAAGWALLGIERLAEARKMFAEAAFFADGDEQSQASRQAARLSFVLDAREQAAATLRPLDRASLSSDESAAVAYDLAVYEAGDDTAAALVLLQEAFSHDTSYCLMALVDPALESHPDARELARKQFARAVERADERAQALAESLKRTLHDLVEQEAEDHEGFAAISLSAAQQETAALLTTLAETGENPPHEREVAVDEIAAAADAVQSRLVDELRDAERERRDAAARREQGRAALALRVESLMEQRTRHLTSGLPRDNAYRERLQEMNKEIEAASAELAAIGP